MKEQLYTIPLNDAVDAKDECPFCFIDRSVEQDLIDFVLGSSASYMEADVRESNNGQDMPLSSPEGFMAKIAVMMNCSFMFESTEEMPEDLAGMLPDYMSYGMRESNQSPAWAGRWSLSAYRYQLMKYREEKTAAVLALEELEKSIVAQLADEVTIGIHGHRIRLVISKRTHKDE